MTQPYTPQKAIPEEIPLFQRLIQLVAKHKQPKEEGKWERS